MDRCRSCIDSKLHLGTEKGSVIFILKNRGIIKMKKLNYIALLPIGVFLVLYLGLGILFEYVMEIPMGFDNVPIVVAFLAAILTACLQNPKLHFDQKSFFCLSAWRSSIIPYTGPDVNTFLQVFSGFSRRLKSASTSCILQVISFVFYNVLYKGVQYRQ